VRTLQTLCPPGYSPEAELDGDGGYRIAQMASEDAEIAQIARAPQARGHIASLIFNGR
jgi:hypothetical protein